MPKYFEPRLDVLPPAQRESHPAPDFAKLNQSYEAETDRERELYDNKPHGQAGPSHPGFGKSSSGL
jgi:hypothetical protein